METNSIREQTAGKVGHLGYQFNPDLPLLGPVTITRHPKEILGRILVLHACVACAFGFPKQRALKWLEDEHITGHITKSEDQFLHSESDLITTKYQWRVEALWCLCWIGGYHSTLDFSKPCSNTMVEMLPDLKLNAPSNEFRQNYNLRNTDEIVKMLDLTYCLHWAVREEQILGISQKGKTEKVQGQVIEERRRALEWVVGKEAWEDISMDT